MLQLELLAMPTWAALCLFCLVPCNRPLLAAGQQGCAGQSMLPDCTSRMATCAGTAQCSCSRHACTQSLLCHMQLAQQRSQPHMHRPSLCSPSQRCACRPTAAACPRRMSSCPPSCLAPSPSQPETMRASCRRLRSAAPWTASECGGRACAFGQARDEQTWVGRDAQLPGELSAASWTSVDAAKHCFRSKVLSACPSSVYLTVMPARSPLLRRSSRLGSKVVLSKELDGAVIALGEVSGSERGRAALLCCSVGLLPGAVDSVAGAVQRCAGIATPGCPRCSGCHPWTAGTPMPAGWSIAWWAWPRRNLAASNRSFAALPLEDGVNKAAA